MKTKNRKIAMVLLPLAVVAAALQGLASPALAATNTVSGTVIGVSLVGDPVPLEGVTVALWDSQSFPDDLPESTITDTAGHFSISGTAPGAARLMAVIPVGVYPADSFDVNTLVFNQIAVSKNGVTIVNDPATQQVTLSETAEVTGVTIGLPVAQNFGTLSGAVTNQNATPLMTQETAASPLQLATVYALDSNGALVSQQTINLDGSYQMPLLAGNYFVMVGASSYSNVLPTYNGGVADIELATPIAVTSGAFTANVNIQAEQLHLFPYPQVAITGNPFVGNTLSAKFSQSVVIPPATNISYQWMHYTCSAVDGVCTEHPIAGETKSTYKLVEADAGKNIYVKVYVSKTGYISETATDVRFGISAKASLAKAPAIAKTLNRGAKFKATAPLFSKSSPKPQNTSMRLIGCATLADAKNFQNGLFSAKCSVIKWGVGPPYSFVLPKKLSSKFVFVETSSNLGANLFVANSNISKVK